MKKTLLLFILSISLIVNAQDLSSIPTCENCVESDYIEKNVWQCGTHNGKIIRSYSFSDGVYRLNNALEILITILRDNNLDFSDPHYNNTYLNSIIDNWSDYYMLDLTIKTGSSYVTRLWEIVSETKRTSIFFKMNEEERVIVIMEEKL